MLQSSGYGGLPAVCCLLVQPSEAFWYPGRIPPWGVLLQERNLTWCVTWDSLYICMCVYI